MGGLLKTSDLDYPDTIRVVCRLLSYINISSLLLDTIAGTTSSHKYFWHMKYSFNHHLTNDLSLYVLVTGLISPGVSVPVQVPGSSPGDVHSSQYWPRIQWGWPLYKHHHQQWSTSCVSIQGKLVCEGGVKNKQRDTFYAGGIVWWKELDLLPTEKLVHASTRRQESLCIRNDIFF